MPTDLGWRPTFSWSHPREVLAHQLLTLVPQRSGPNWIEGIGANSLADLIARRSSAETVACPSLPIGRSSPSTTRPAWPDPHAAPARYGCRLDARQLRARHVPGDADHTRRRRGRWPSWNVRTRRTGG